MASHMFCLRKHLLTTGGILCFAILSLLPIYLFLGNVGFAVDTLTEQLTYGFCTGLLVALPTALSAWLYGTLKRGLHLGLTLGLLYFLVAVVPYAAVYPIVQYIADEVFYVLPDVLWFLLIDILPYLVPLTVSVIAIGVTTAMIEGRIFAKLPPGKEREASLSQADITRNEGHWSKDRWLISGVVVYVAVQIYAFIVLIPAGMTGEFEMLWFVVFLPGLIIATLAGLSAATYGIALHGRRFGLRWGFLHFDAAAIAFAISLIATETFRFERSLFVICLPASVGGVMVATWLMTRLEKPTEQV